MSSFTFHPGNPMRRTGLVLAVLALGVAVPAAAQGRRAPRSVLLLNVVDEQGRPIPGAYVTVAGVERGETTDAEGRAKVAWIPQGNRLVGVRRQGYAFRRIAADFAGGDTVRREVAMTPAPVELEGIVATTWGRSVRLRNNGFYSRQRRGLGSFMTREHLDQVRLSRTTDAFRHMRGFMVRPSGARDIVVAAHGLGGCLPAVYVDGATMFVRSASDQSMALNMVSPDDIEAIEAYQGPGSIPAEYNMMGSACGVILIWTRSYAA
jgi:hypothetical protein